MQEIVKIVIWLIVQNPFYAYQFIDGQFLANSE